LPGATAAGGTVSTARWEFARNVTVATLAPFFGSVEASGATLIVAPGGGFRVLSMEQRLVVAQRRPSGRGGIRAQIPPQPDAT
jgi:hypothetical protein